MNESPEQDDIMIRRLLTESGVEESPELLEGLRRLRFYSAASAPIPTGELGQLLAERPEPAPKRPHRRNRGLILSFTLAAAMAAGATGVAANTGTGLRLTASSPITADRETVSGQEITAQDAEAETPAPSQVIPEDTDNADLPAPVAADASSPGDPSGVSGPGSGADGGVSAPPAAAAPVHPAPGLPEVVDPECEDDDVTGCDSGTPDRDSGADTGVRPDGRNGPERSGPGRNGGVRPDGGRSNDRENNAPEAPRETGGPGPREGGGQDRGPGENGRSRVVGPGGAGGKQAENKQSGDKHPGNPGQGSPGRPGGAGKP
ncbi:MULTISPECIES: hypothetical protein [unclassified Arthrobacter]|uniref:hypothetical protein n=1 Tax=unclassified Arthrobacter TaxID=235627 RepID=UPI000CE34870|nr:MULTISPECIES: hypothetical protein [unclassified Arthrobacter]